MIKEYLVDNRQEVLSRLGCNEIFFSMDRVCYWIADTDVNVVDCLRSNQEEADTKLLLQTKHALNAEQDKSIIVRSHSSDVDIDVLFLAMFLDDNNRIFLDYETGENRKVLKLSEVNMDNEKRSALVGFHAFTGNAYISSIFRKSKKACCKLLERNNNYVSFASWEHLGAW